MLTSHLQGKRLVINVDVSNSCFWHETGLHELSRKLTGELSQATFQAVASRRPDGRDPEAMPMLKRLCRNKFTVKHRGVEGSLRIHLKEDCGADLHSDATKIWTIKQIARVNAKDHKFDVTDKATGKTTNMSVYEYFFKKYTIILEYWWLPLVQTQKAGILFPMELCRMCIGQRYPYKLNSDQV